MASRIDGRGAAAGGALAAAGPLDAAIASVFREEAGRIVASLARATGDFDVAEEAVQDALVAALRTWPGGGIPERPGAWLQTTARRKAIDRLRRVTVEAKAVAKLREERQMTVATSGDRDERLELIFTCCHPALSREAQLALTLRAVGGLTTPEIAKAFLTTEATVAQRIVRAKRKIVDAHITMRVPADDELAERLDTVLAVLYLMFNEGYLASGPRAERRDLAEDAAWLAGLVAELLPGQPEALGLQALLGLHLARVAARFDEAGSLVLLRDQDRTRWDATRIRANIELLDRAARMRRPGPYQLQAAIAACHAEAPSWEATDWPEILGLYEVLVLLQPSPVARLNRAIALRMVAGPEEALRAIAPLEEDLDRYHLFYATRAEFLRALGRVEDARADDARALERTENPAERSLLERRLS